MFAIIGLTPLFVLMGTVTQDFGGFHQDLLFNGLPIHPFTVVKAVQGVSLPEAEPLVPIGLVQFDFEVNTKENLTFDAKANAARCELSHGEHALYDYQYLGTYQNKHIIHCETHTGGTGYFGLLGLVTRRGDALMSAGLIAEGDRGWGSEIEKITLSHNLLRYSQKIPIGVAVNEISGEPIIGMIEYTPACSGNKVTLLYEVNLDHQLLPSSYLAVPLSSLIGLSLDDSDAWPIDCLESDRDRLEHCFANVKKLYLVAGKKELDLEETKAFVQEVVLRFHIQKSVEETGDFPKDLTFHGLPLHPTIVMRTQNGLQGEEPITIEPPDFSDWHYGNFQKDILTYEKKTHTITSKVCYQSSDLIDGYDVHSYQYIGTYKNKHVIYCEEYNSVGMRFHPVFLGLVERLDDTIINAGSITSGDHGDCGIINIISLHNNLLQYAQNIFLQDHLFELSKQKWKESLSPTTFEELFNNYCHSGLCRYEVNLDFPDLPPKLVGLMFHKEDYENGYYRDGDLSKWPKWEIFDYCFDLAARPYVKNGKKELNLEEALEFADKVVIKFLQIESAPCEK